MTLNKIFMKWDKGDFGFRAGGIIQRDDRVLLCRVGDADWWFPPGGGVHLQETSHQALKREFLEETGFDVEVQRLVFIIENFFVHENVRYHTIEFIFIVSPIEQIGKWTQEEFIGREEYEEELQSRSLVFKWFDKSELDQINLLPSILRDTLKDIPEHPVHIINHDDQWYSL
jgi:ADP-ribose pyrophosphatase YjhB (NUDIX family)